MTVLPSSGEIPTGRKNDFESALQDGVRKLDDTAAAEAAANDEPTPSLADTLRQLTEIVNEPETPPATPKPGDPPAEPPVPESKKEVETLMAELADEPQSIQAAVRRALESGMQAKDAIEAVLAERDNIIAHAQLVSEVDALGKRFPSFTPEMLQKTLDHLSKLPEPLANELSLEEVAARALGRDALEQAKAQPKPPAPKAAPNGAPSRPGHRMLAEAEVIGDATPGAPMDGKPFDAGRGNSFNDLAAFILQKHPGSIMQPAGKK